MTETCKREVMLMTNCLLFQAALKNPNVSEEAKDNAERVLEENDAI